MIALPLLLLLGCLNESFGFSLGDPRDHGSIRKKDPSRPIAEEERVALRSQLRNHEDDIELESSKPAPSLEKSPLGPPTTTIPVLQATETGPRRIFVSTLSATGVALAANFLGLTSVLLSLIPESAVEKTGLDTYYPRSGFKRYSGKLYTFVMPQAWVGDTALELQKAQLRARPLDYSMRSSRRSLSYVLPDVAFGPPGRLSGREVSSGDTNVSVIVSDVLPGFSLAGTLGTPEQAAEYILKGMRRDFIILNARLDQQRDVYELVYQVNRREQGVESLRYNSVIGFISATNTLVTQTVVAPASKWENPKEQAKLQKVASSFRLKSTTA